MSSRAAEPVPFYDALVALRKSLFPPCHDPCPWVKGMANEVANSFLMTQSAYAVVVKFTLSKATLTTGFNNRAEAQKGKFQGPEILLASIHMSILFETNII